MAVYTKDDIRDLAGQASYDRGMDYIDSVGGLTYDDAQVSATVVGTWRYTVDLDITDGLDGTCTCPYGEEGNFCKHCVAVALVYLYHAENGTLATVSRAASTLADYLSSLDRAELVDLLLDVTDRDPALRQRLELRAIAPMETTVDIDDATEYIDTTLSVGDYVEYAEAGDYADQVNDLTAWLAELHHAGHGTVVIGLVQYALQRLGGAFESIDDSSGRVSDAAEQLAELHAQVCTDIRPDPNELAVWVLDFQASGFDVPSLDIDDYVEVLGEEGLARYGEQLTARWHALRDNDSDDDSYAVVSLMRGWAQMRGDLDLLISALSSPQSHEVAYQRIVTVLTDAGRHAEALEWAERGVADTSARADEFLVEFLAARYAEAGRAKEVLALRRGHLQRRRSLAAYQPLREAALAVDDWPDTRQWALELLRPTGGPTQRASWAWHDNVLVDVLLWESATEQAWTAAHEYGVSDPQWLRLAEARGATHPKDAIDIYQRIIGQRIEARNNHSYREAADLVVRVMALYRQLNEPDSAAKASAYVASLRTAHRPKRNFMAELTRRDL